MLKEKLFQTIDSVRADMTAMADDLFDHPEIGLEEFHALEVLTGWLKKEGFAVETGTAGVETAFKAVYHHGIRHSGRRKCQRKNPHDPE